MGTVCSPVWDWDKYLVGTLHRESHGLSPALCAGDLIHMPDTCHCPHASTGKMVSIRREEDERSA